MGSSLRAWLLPWLWPDTPVVARAPAARPMTPEEALDAARRQAESEKRAYTQWNDPSRRWR